LRHWLSRWPGPARNRDADHVGGAAALLAALLAALPVAAL